MNDKAPPGEQLEPANPWPHVLLPPLHERVDSSATGGGSIRAVYEHGIEFIDQMGSIDGYMAAWMGTAALICLALGIWTLLDAPTAYPLHALWVFGLVLTLAVGRIDSVGYRYQPVLFDKQAQKVHLFSDLGTPWWEVWKLFGRTSFRVDSFDWESVRGEVAELQVLGGTNLPRKEYALMLAVTDRPGGTNVIARFGVGFTMGYDGGATQMGRWEHIRRYMRGEGPALAYGDALYVDESMGNWWGALTFAQPLLGPGSKAYWTGEALRGAWFLTIPVGLFMLVFLLPLTVPASLIRWLAHKGKGVPRWPDEIQASVGSSVDPPMGGPRASHAAIDYGKPIPQFTLKEKRARDKRRKQGLA
ncbi:DUF6708 domain-containing protein [Caldimonas mangrovi]|uniref:DUF6708 domain-containing protein n=1 Tax=Caldimonas mangrovi TaxID=2944811 RepID=UPI0020447209|nr:DUF6708 domain-containing protein [Caldimonas mangrovi]